MHKHPKIAIVEDDEFILNMYETKFDEEKFEVFSADNGVLGMELIKKEIPDIVLLDILLPKKDGYEVLAEMKELEKTKNIPVILLTNIGQKDSIERGMKLGAKDYLIKAHFTPSEVVGKVKSILIS